MFCQNSPDLGSPQCVALGVEVDSIIGKICTKKASLSLNEKASQEPHPIHPLEQPHLGPLQRIPDMKIPNLV